MSNRPPTRQKDNTSDTEQTTTDVPTPIENETNNDQNEVAIEKEPVTVFSSDTDPRKKLSLQTFILSAEAPDSTTATNFRSDGQSSAAQRPGSQEGNKSVAFLTSKNPFINFFKAYQRHHPDLTVVELASKVAQLWNAMSTREQRSFSLAAIERLRTRAQNHLERQRMQEIRRKQVRGVRKHRMSRRRRDRHKLCLECTIHDTRKQCLKLEKVFKRFLEYDKARRERAAKGRKRKNYSSSSESGA